MNLSRALAWLVLSLVVGPALAPIASAEPPVTAGKFCAIGVSCVPYAATTALDFPYSHPTFGDSPLTSGDLVYDTQIGVEIVNGNPVAEQFSVSAETWVQGTTTVFENETGPNGSYSIVGVDVPARLDASWSNATVSAAPFSDGEVELPLRESSSPVVLELAVGSASWSLTYLTPATSSVAGVYTAAGLWGVSATVAGATFAAILVALYAASGLSRRIGRSPPVPRWWPILWAVIPAAAFSFAYVGFNQVLGPMSPAFLPIPLAVAAFPYLPRLFTKDFDMAECEGIEPITLDDARNPKMIMPLVSTQGGLKCAPQTWREAFLSHWAGLPEVRGYEVDLLGGKTRVQPRLLKVSNPLPRYYRAEATASFWYDARKGIKRPRHKFELMRTEKVPVLGADGVTQTGFKLKHRISPRIVPGFLEATFPPKRSVAHELAGVRSAEIESHDHEVERLENADLRGSLRHLSRTYAKEAVRAHEDAAQRRDRPRTREELSRQVEANRKARTAAAPPEDRKETEREA